MAGIGRGDLSVGDSPLLVVPRQLWGNAEHSRNAERLEQLQVSRVLAVSQVKEGQNPGGRVGFDVRQVGRRRSRGQRRA